MVDLAWECACGNIEYDAAEPEECSECGKIGNFTQLPEELIEEREKDLGIDDLDLSEREMKKIKSKDKSPKSKKPSRRKK